jgi:hypothetical protein
MSFGMTTSFMELPGQKLLDPVDLGSYVARRETGDLGDGSCVHPFEVRKNDLAVKRIEPLDEAEQAFERLALVDSGFLAREVRLILEILEADKLGLNAALAEDIGRGYVVRNPIYPGADGAAAVESFEAAPQGQVDVLEKIPAAVRIGFVAARHPVERGAKAGSGIPVQVVLAGSYSRNGFEPLHNQIVARGSGFLQTTHNPNEPQVALRRFRQATDRGQGDVGGNRTEERKAIETRIPNTNWAKTILFSEK